MKKIINLIKNNIFGFIIGVLMTSSVGVIAATLYYSNQVSYTPTDTTWNVSNVDDALNELYSTSSNNGNAQLIGCAVYATRFTPSNGYGYLKGVLDLTWNVEETEQVIFNLGVTAFSSDQASPSISVYIDGVIQNLSLNANNNFTLDLTDAKTFRIYIQSGGFGGAMTSNSNYTKGGSFIDSIIFS